MTEPARPGDDAAGKRGRTRLLIVVAVLLPLLVAGAFLGLKLRAPAAAAEPAEPVEGAVVDVATMTASLGQAHLARVGFAVVLSADAAETDVAADFPLLKDAAIDEIASSDAAQLTTPEGVDGLRDRLTARATALYPDGDVVRVVLTELVVQ